MSVDKRSPNSGVSISLEGLAGRNSSAGYKLGTKFVYACPVCGDSANEKHGAIIRWRDGWSISCLRCPGGSDYLRELRQAVGCDASGYALLSDPLAHLGDLLQRQLTPSSPAALPTHAHVAGWHERLMTSGAPLEYLLTNRGLSEEVIARYKLGWDGAAFMLPIYSIHKRQLVNLRRRSWPRPFPNGARYVGLPGRTKRNGGVQLYPDVPRRGGLLVCGGEMDALVARSHGLPGVTCTAGVATAWPRPWNRLIAGRNVVVAYDVGEEAHAKRRVEALRDAGANAWAIDLGSTGLADKEDLTDWFVGHGRDAERLRALARTARPKRHPQRAGTLMAGAKRRIRAAVDGVVWMTDVAEERLQWVWRGYIPQGKLTVLDGDPGLGKSTVAYDLAARLSVGSELPDGRPLCDEASVCLIVSGEDDFADTIKPRLRAAGADMRRIATLALRHDERGDVIPFTVPDDTGRLRKAIRATKATFVVIDPIMAFLSESINSHNDASVRRALGSLTALAQDTRAAFLALRHLNKDQATTKAMYRGGGSIAITGAARSVLMVASQRDDPAVKVVAQTKNNLIGADEAPSLAYSIKPWSEDRDIPRISWIGTSDLTADDLLRQGDGRRDDYARREAIAFWKSILAKGPKPMSEVETEAEDEGITTSTLKRAGKDVGLHKYRRRDRNGRTIGWYAHLAEHSCPKGCRGSQGVSS